MGSFPRRNYTHRRKVPEVAARDAHILHTVGLQILTILVDAKYVHQSYLAAGLEHARNLAHCLAASLAALDIVDGDAGYYSIDAVISERKFAHIAIEHFDPIDYTLSLGVGKGSGSAIAALIYLRPEINAYGLPPRQAFGRPDKQYSMPAAYVEYGFIAAQVQSVEKTIAYPHFTDFAAKYIRQPFQCRERSSYQ